jgi:hypothetical protein
VLFPTKRPDFGLEKNAGLAGLLIKWLQNLQISSKVKVNSGIQRAKGQRYLLLVFLRKGKVCGEEH